MPDIEEMERKTAEQAQEIFDTLKALLIGKDTRAAKMALTRLLTSIVRIEKGNADEECAHFAIALSDELHVHPINGVIGPATALLLSYLADCGDPKAIELTKIAREAAADRGQAEQRHRHRGLRALSRRRPS